MKMIPRIAITDAMLLDCSVAETDHPAWAVGTTYAAGDLVMRSQTHRIYRSLQASNVGKTPETNTDWWHEVGPTARWAAFDDALGSALSGPSPLTVTLQPGVIDSVGLFDIVGSTLSMSYKDSASGSVIWTETASLDATSVTSVSDWFFEEYEQQTRLIRTDVPYGFTNGVLNVTLTGAGTVSIGALAVGRARVLGETLSGLNTGIHTYSTLTQDAGRSYFVKRRSADTQDVKTIFSNADLATIRRALVKAEMTPCIWLPSDVSKFDELAVYGIFESFNVDVAYATSSYCNLRIKGFT